MYIKGFREFKVNKYYNLRNSTYTKKFIDCIFEIYNGKYYIKNDPIFMSINTKYFKSLNFKLGQFSYNKKIQLKGGSHKNVLPLFEDIKKKRGVSVKIKKKKKLVFIKK